MRVIATAKGYDNVTIREPGEEFDAPLGIPNPQTGKREPITESSWYKPVAAPHGKPSESHGKPTGKGGDSLV